MDIHQLLFGVYPYIAMTVFVVGCWIRFDTAQYTWKSDSTQLLSKEGVMLSSNLFHVGIIAIFFGHLVGLLLGLSTLPVSIGHANHGDAGVMIALAEWAQSIVTLQPKPHLLAAVDPVYQAHLFCGMTVFLLFPFSRLVHIWSAPVGYLGRAYQIVRTRRA